MHRFASRVKQRSLSPNNHDAHFFSFSSLPSWLWPTRSLIFQMLWVSVGNQKHIIFFSHRTNKSFKNKGNARTQGK
jgi:hypothetical protein